MNKKPLGVYIHIPFCVKKCLYCDFLSFTGAAKQREEYTKAVIREIEERIGSMEEYVVDTVFIGGGTPSVLEVSTLKQIIDALHYHSLFHEDTEFSMECNPGTVTRKKLEKYRQYGINRISFGLQSTIKEELELLGRIHTYEDFKQSYKWAREAGFTNINVDLMSGIPGQTKESFQKTCQRILTLEPEHISAYSLIVEPETPFYERYHEIPPMSEELDLEIYQYTKEVLSQVGYGRYEVSNYAKPGFECRHNMKYWSQEDTIGFGIGAASLQGNKRWKNHEDFSTYCQGDFRPCEEEFLSKQEQMEEYVIFGLRKIKGVSLASFEQRFSERLTDVFWEPIEKYVRMKMLETDGNSICFTTQGLEVSNLILADFMIG